MSGPPAAAGSADAFRYILSCFSEPPIYVREQLVAWQEACLSDVAAVTALVAAHSKPTEPALGMRHSAFLGGAITLLSSSTIMGLLDFGAGPSKRLILTAPRLPKGVEAGPASIHHAAAAAGNDAFRDKLPVALQSCEALARLLVCPHVDQAMQRRFLPEVLLGLMQCQAWCNAKANAITNARAAAGAAAEEEVNAVLLEGYRKRVEAALSLLIAPSSGVRDGLSPSPPPHYVLPMHKTAAALLSITCGEATMGYKLLLVTPSMGATTAAGTSGASKEEASSSAPLPPRPLMLAASALLVRVIVNGGLEAFCDAVADAADLSDPMAADRARLTVAALLARPVLEVVGSPLEYLRAVVPQLLRLLRLRSRAGATSNSSGIDWLHSVACLSLTQMLASKSFLVLDDNNKNNVDAGASTSSDDSPALSSLLQSRADLLPVPVPPSLRPLHLVVSQIVVPLIRPLLAFAVPPFTIISGSAPDEGKPNPWAGTAPYLRYCCGLPPGVGKADKADEVALFDEDAVMGSVELLHAVLTRGTPLPRALVTRVLGLALPALFTLFHLARSNKLRRGGFGVACLEVICKIIGQMPSKGAALALLMRSAAAATATTATRAAGDNDDDDEASDGPSELLASSFSFRDWYHRDVRPMMLASSSPSPSSSLVASAPPTGAGAGAADVDEEAFACVFNTPLPVPQLYSGSTKACYSFELGESAGYRLVAGRPESVRGVSSGGLLKGAADSKKARQALNERVASALLEVVALASSSSSSTQTSSSPSSSSASSSLSLSTLLVAYLLHRYGEAKTRSLRDAAQAAITASGLVTDSEAAGLSDSGPRVHGSPLETTLLLRIMGDDGSSDGNDGQAGAAGIMLPGLGGIHSAPSSSSSASSAADASTLASGRAVKSQFIGSLSLSLASMALAGAAKGPAEDADADGSREPAAPSPSLSPTTTASSVLALVSVRSVLHMTLSSLALPMPADLRAVGLGSSGAAGDVAATTTTVGFTAASIHARACERFPLPSFALQGRDNTAPSASRGGLVQVMPGENTTEPTSAKKPTSSLITVVDGGDDSDVDSDDGLRDSAAPPQANHAAQNAPASRDQGNESGYQLSSQLLSLLSASDREDTEDLIVLCLSLLTAAAVDLLMATTSGEDQPAVSASSPSSSSASSVVWEVLRSCLPLLAALSGYAASLRRTHTSTSRGSSSLLNLVSRGGTADRRKTPLASSTFLSGISEAEEYEAGDEDSSTDELFSASGGVGLRSAEIEQMAASLRALLLTLPAPAAAKNAKISAPPDKGGSASAAGTTEHAANTALTVDLGDGRRLAYDKAVAEAVQLVAVGAGAGKGAGDTAPSGSEPALQAAGCRMLSRVFASALKAGDRACAAIFNEDMAGEGKDRKAWAEDPELGPKGRMLLELLLQQLHHSDAPVNLAAIDALSALAALRPAAMLPVLVELFAPEAYRGATHYLKQQAAKAPVRKGKGLTDGDEGRYLGSSSLEEVLNGEQQRHSATARSDAATSQVLSSRLRARIGEALTLAIRRLSGGAYLTTVGPSFSTATASDSSATTSSSLSVPWAYLLAYVLLQVGVRQGWRVTESLALQLVEATVDREQLRRKRRKELEAKRSKQGAVASGGASSSRLLIEEVGDKDEGGEESDDEEGDDDDQGHDGQTQPPRRHPYNLALSLVDASDLRASAVACLSELLVAVSGNARTLTGRDRDTEAASAASVGSTLESASSSLAAFLFSANPVNAAAGPSGGGCATVCEDLLSGLEGVLTFESRPPEGITAIRKLLEAKAPSSIVGGEEASGDERAAIDPEVRQVIVACSARVRRAAASSHVRLLGLLLRIPSSSVKTLASDSQASSSSLALGSGFGEVASSSSVMQGLLRPGANAAGVLLHKRGAGAGEEMSASVARRSNLAFVTNAEISALVRGSYNLLQRTSSDDPDDGVRRHALGGLALVDEAMRASLGIS